MRIVVSIARNQTGGTYRIWISSSLQVTREAGMAAVMRDVVDNVGVGG